MDRADPQSLVTGRHSVDPGSRPRHRPLSSADRGDVTQQAETKHAQCHKFVSNIFMGLFRGRSIFQVFLLLIIVSGQSAEGGWAVPTPLWLTAGHTHCKHRDTLITSSDIIPALVKRIVSSLSRARVISVSLKYLARPSGQPLP